MQVQDRRDRKSPEIGAEALRDADAAGEWTPEGERKSRVCEKIRNGRVCETEKALRKQRPAYDGTR